MHPWLRELRHDLLKRALWAARDLHDAGGQDVAALRRGLFELTDAEGAPIDALALWARMRAESPAPRGALDAFEAALQHAVRALDAPWPAPLDAVLALEPAFTALAGAVPET
jgi:hypothetical protein